MKNITGDHLIELGFNKYSPSNYDCNSVDEVYQKRYADNLGIKYHLTVKHYDLTHPTTGEDLSDYEVSGQFYMKDNHNAINMTFIDSDVEEAEEFINKLFDIGLLEYYEKWS